MENSTAGSRAWGAIRRLAPIALIALSFVLLRKQLPDAARALVHARPIALLCVPLFFVWNELATIGWRALLRASGVTVAPLRTLVRLRIEAQAVNQIVPAAGLAGEGLRTVRAAQPGELAAASFATLLDNVAGTLSGLVFAACALGLRFQTRTGAESELKTLTLTTVGALALLVVAVALPFQLGHKLVPRLAPGGRARRLLEPFADRRLSIRRALRDAVALRFCERILSAAEVYVFFLALDAPVSVADAALISAVFIVVSFTVFFLPGQLGAAEAAVAMTSTLIGVPATLGLSVALLRRARQLGVCVTGLVSVLVAKQRGPLLRTPVEKAQ
ncbi:MAG TPA: lysylphosphatidylglycerol synthase transmembrane domain-containing protein [Polyangiaceae bacterium]|nr:lysylphosphatidylglycerol synthase transmembrane domain-containing protein [Polyangiaceae bacterium]